MGLGSAKVYLLPTRIMLIIVNTDIDITQKHIARGLFFFVPVCSSSPDPTRTQLLKHLAPSVREVFQGLGFWNKWFFSSRLFLKYRQLLRGVSYVRLSIGVSSVRLRAACDLTCPKLLQGTRQTPAVPGSWQHPGAVISHEIPL